MLTSGQRMGFFLRCGNLLIFFFAFSELPGLWAVENENRDVLKALVRCGAKVDVKNDR